uniref:Protein SAAL1 n=1 Tax=Rhipicephalus appendiculatus TaxID=34631 RepID=A0A131YGP1_RHIAP
MDDTERNPSPPPEIREADETSSGDRIGESVFSRHWLFQCLLKAIRAAENENACGEGEQVLTEEEVVELDREVEEELCTVWDMAANSDVAHFLHEFKASEIFLQIISTSKSPRLVVSFKAYYLALL